MRRWKCKVCGYIHEGAEPPEKCPVCMADKSQFAEIDANGDEITAAPVEEARSAPVPQETVVVPAPRQSRFGGMLAKLVLGLHIHPISVHFPNGLLPASVVFLAIGIFLGLAAFNEAAFFNMIFVLAMMPVVMVTGYLEWQKRYQGAKTFLFMVKISCSIVVLLCLLALVIWRFINPTVTDPASTDRLLYLGISLVMLVAAAIAGHLGGKLVFAGRGR